MNSDMTVEVASPPDRDDLVAELWQANAMWGEVRWAGGRFVLELYPKPGDGAWSFGLDEVLECLEESKRTLIRMEVAPPSAGARSEVSGEH